MVTAVLFVQNAAPNSITQFHDLISNELPVPLGPWSFDLKIFLNNKYSKPSNIHPSQVPNRYLYSLQLSYLPQKTITIINNTKSITTVTSLTANVSEKGSEVSNSKDSKDVSNSKNAKLKEHFLKGCSLNTTTDSFDLFVMNKLQNLWALKQVIKGESGYGYLINVANINSEDSARGHETFKIRTSNCFLHGTFKGFLIEIEHIETTASEEAQNIIMSFSKSISKIKTLIEVYKFPQGRLCFNVLSDSKLDYESDLCQQYSDALQF
ncbi:unnamed protein product [Kuraishia capsulata CBS 1993]|uniref:Mediator of RNA polymerase II transcription subunit 20 n=1 Tax=Kuraishia capsulata CBS 1993 TaxID=1382522 RepID=W6MPZ7_9ASCO|nr:uncharacterized protein KUCA_T00004725001 [Kuraishia capsulata CBS 1993]CDK28741.1 unnamed protein product [Kuraishia capsulata CBS 1993]